MQKVPTDDFEVVLRYAVVRLSAYRNYHSLTESTRRFGLYTDVVVSELRALLHIAEFEPAFIDYAAWNKAINFQMQKLSSVIFQEKERKKRENS